MTTNAEQIAAWMFKKFDDNPLLYQSEVVWDIKSEFGDDWVYENPNGNLGINKDILREFKKLHKGSAEWDRGSRYWEYCPVKEG